jgi:hypothetical protein
MPDVANLRIVPYNFHDDATLTADPVAADKFPVTNSQTTARDQVFRSTGLDDQVIKGTYSGDGRRANAFAFFRHNAHAGTVRLQLYSDDAWTTQVYDSTAITADTFGAFDSLGDFDWGFDFLGSAADDPLALESPFILYFDTTEFLSYEITFSGFASGLGCLEVGRIWLGKYFESAINPAYGVALGVGENTSRVRTHGGSNRTTQGARWRTFAIDLNYMDEADRPIWLDIMQKLQTSRDFVLSLFPGAGGRQERDYLLNGKFTTLDAIYYQQAFRTKRLQGEEI